MNRNRKFEPGQSVSWEGAVKEGVRRYGCVLDGWEIRSSKPGIPMVEVVACNGKHWLWEELLRLEEGVDDPVGLDHKLTWGKCLAEGCFEDAVVKTPIGQWCDFHDRDTEGCTRLVQETALEQWLIAEGHTGIFNESRPAEDLGGLPIQCDVPEETNGAKGLVPPVENRLWKGEKPKPAGNPYRGGRLHQ